MRRMATDAGLITQTIQTALIAVHNSTGLDWWATIALSTFGMRVSLMPLVRMQMHSSTKLANALPEINLLYSLLCTRLKDNVTLWEHGKTLKVFFQGIRSCLTLHDTSVTEIFSFPIANVSLFITVVWAFRDLLLHGDASLMLSEGGLNWFEDLTRKDATYLLPLTAVGLTYANLDFSFSQGSNTPKTRFSVFLQDSFQCLGLLSLATVATLPAGVFCYWIPNGIWTMTQSLAFRSPVVREVFRLPPIRVPPVVAAVGPAAGPEGAAGAGGAEDAAAAGGGGQGENEKKDEKTDK